jgi:hypothetical protein
MVMMQLLLYLYLAVACSGIQGSFPAAQVLPEHLLPAPCTMAAMHPAAQQDQPIISSPVCLPEGGCNSSCHSWPAPLGACCVQDSRTAIYNSAAHPDWGTCV